MATAKANRQAKATAAEYPVPRRFREGGSTDFLHMLRQVVPDGVSACVGDTSDQVAMFAQSYEVDEASDAVLAAGVQARRQVEYAIEHGIEAVENPHPAVRAFFETVDNLPPAIDLKKVEAGVRVFRRIDPVSGFLAGYGVGFILAAILANSARSLMVNERMIENPTKRVIETYKYVLDYSTPGGYERFGSGTKTACRLRLGHAGVRKYIDQRGEWDRSLYGAPISTGDVIGAALAATTFTAAACQLLGYRLSDEEKTSLAHLCAAMQYRHGVPAELVVTTWDDQLRYLVYALLPSRADADPEATRAVIGPMLRLDAGPATRSVNSLIAGYNRLLFGDELCDLAGIPSSPTSGLLRVSSLAVRAAEAVRVHLPPADWAIRRTSDVVMGRVLPQLMRVELNIGQDHYATIART